MQHGAATVHAGIHGCYTGCCRLRHDYIQVAPRLRPGVTLHYKTRVKT